MATIPAGEHLIAQLRALHAAALAKCKSRTPEEIVKECERQKALRRIKKHVRKEQDPDGK